MLAALRSRHPSLYLLQGVAEYLRLMRVLPPSVPVIFQGLCSLFETTLVRLFGAFGRHEALHANSDQITPRLKSTLVRLTNNASISNLMPGQGGGVGSEGMERALSSEICMVSKKG